MVTTLNEAIKDFDRFLDIGTIFMEEGFDVEKTYYKVNSTTNTIMPVELVSVSFVNKHKLARFKCVFEDKTTSRRVTEIYVEKKDNKELSLCDSVDKIFFSKNDAKKFIINNVLDL